MATPPTAAPNTVPPDKQTGAHAGEVVMPPGTVADAVRVTTAGAVFCHPALAPLTIGGPGTGLGSLAPLLDAADHALDPSSLKDRPTAVRACAARGTGALAALGDTLDAEITLALRFRLPPHTISMRAAWERVGQWSALLCRRLVERLSALPGVHVLGMRAEANNSVALESGLSGRLRSEWTPAQIIEGVLHAPQGALRLQDMLMMTTAPVIVVALRHDTGYRLVELWIDQSLTASSTIRELGIGTTALWFGHVAAERRHAQTLAVLEEETAKSFPDRYHPAKMYAYAAAGGLADSLRRGLGGTMLRRLAPAAAFAGDGLAAQQIAAELRTPWGDALVAAGKLASALRLMLLAPNAAPALSHDDTRALLASCLGRVRSAFADPALGGPELMASLDAAEAAGAGTEIDAVVRTADAAGVAAITAAELKGWHAAARFEATLRRAFPGDLPTPLFAATPSA